MSSTALLVMAYGTPRDLDDVEPYYTDIRRGKPPPPDLLEELRDRYRAIGGHSPLFEITTRQGEGIAARLGVPGYLGQKHAAPTIPDAVTRMKADGIGRAIGLVLAPHYSSMSIGDYERRVHRAAGDVGWDGSFEVIPSWHTEPGYVKWLTGSIERARAELPPDTRDGALVVFTAHSLPARILDAGDPYAAQLEETARTVAGEAGLPSWRTGWQSAGRTADPWLGPDLLEVLDEEARRGTSAIVVCPCGFVADHLEVLYDVDIEATARADELGMALVRTAMPNDDDDFLDMLAGVVRRRLSD